MISDDERARRITKKLAETEDLPLRWWWLSFCDTSRAPGSQFLGVAIVRGQSVAHAAMEAARLGCNPGGQIAGYECPADRERFIPDDAKNRLMTEAECVDADMRMAAARVSAARRPPPTERS